MFVSTALTISATTWALTVLPQGGDWDEAENLYRRAMKVAMIYRGREHPHVATYANNLGELLKKKVSTCCTSPRV